jgi:hypothetical protein
MSEKCIIIGAGASYGFNSTLSEDERPPLGKDILSKSIEIGALTEWKYPMLFSLLKEYTKNNNKDDVRFSDIDIEEFLEYVANKLQQINGILDTNVPKPNEDQIQTITSALEKDFQGTWQKIKNEIQNDNDSSSKIRRIASKYQSALGESWYLMFEVFKKYSFSYRPNHDAYQRLALSHMNESYNLISLNYDVIFELAASTVDMVVQYPTQNTGLPKTLPLVDPRKIISMAKVHGSINWFNSYSRGINLGKTNERGYSLLHKISGFIYSNRVQMEPTLIVNFTQLLQTEIQDILLSGSKYYEPALLPPIGNYKDYEKVKYFENNWKAAEGYVKSASELVVIGTSIRDQDTKLRQLIKDNVVREIPITLVGSHDVEPKIKSLLGNKASKLSFVDSFEQYANKL